METLPIFPGVVVSCWYLQGFATDLYLQVHGFAIDLYVRVHGFALGYYPPLPLQALIASDHHEALC